MPRLPNPSAIALQVLLASAALVACSSRKFEEGHKGNNTALATLDTWEVKITFARDGKTLDTFYTRRTSSGEYLRAFYFWSPDANRVVCVVCSSYGQVQAAFDYKTGSEFQLGAVTSQVAAKELGTLARLECPSKDLAFCLCTAARNRWDLQPNITLAALATPEPDSFR